MATQMITVKLDDSFLEDVDQVVKTKGYQNRTEFIRNALREKVDKVKMDEAILELAYLKGSAKKRTSAKEYEAVRKRAFEELDKLN
jgi:metal-responsive CopG/Arc/MetJ family transcriptional regulator